MAAKSKKHERRRAREDALSLLYSSDIMESDAVALIEDGTFPEDIALGEYAESLVRGVTEHREDIDARLASTSENWSVERMPVVDRVLLRLAVYEMVYVDEVPVSVAINEAVELAKVYGGEDESSRFVNGVLGRIARSLEEAPQPAADQSDTPVPDASEHPTADQGEAPAPDASAQPTADQGDAPVAP